MLAKLSPLLGSAVGLEQGDSFAASLSPLQMHLPADCYSVRLQPLKLVLSTKGVINGVIALLKCAPCCTVLRPASCTVPASMPIGTQGAMLIRWQQYLCYKATGLISNHMLPLSISTVVGCC